MQFEREVIQWAQDRGLVTEINAKTQLLKSFEEMGEVARAVLKNNQEELVDGLGDVLVTLIILAEIKGVKLEECLESAYNVIKNRTGKTVNGTFIKNE
jgi:NTP pyrophosphatase (non-canonical NTP hydrolase)